jgi:hypothetical protein
MNDLNKSDFDSPWKDMLENYFAEFMSFFFPQAYSDIEWQKHYKFLDKEFQQITQDSGIGRRSVDKLVEVWRKNGEESWVLVHVEIQGQKDTDFAKRMYTYNYRIFDRYNRSVASLAILSDENPNWHPKQFSYSLWGCNVGIEFPAIKLLDYREQWNELEESRNPFAVAVMAHLKVQETRGNYEERKRWKFYLARRLYERGHKKEDIIQLLKFIDWIMLLPKDLEDGFWQEIEKCEEGEKMPYMLSLERFAIERTIRQSLFDALEIKYEKIPEKLTETINSIDEIDALRALLRHAIKCNSLEEFEEKMRSVIE